MRLHKYIIALSLVFAMGVQAETYKAPRGPDGKHPDLNGIWQALNSANWAVGSASAPAGFQMADTPGARTAVINFRVSTTKARA